MVIEYKPPVLVELIRVDEGLVWDAESHLMVTGDAKYGGILSCAGILAVDKVQNFVGRVLI